MTHIAEEFHVIRLSAERRPQKAGALAHGRPLSRGMYTALGHPVRRRLLKGDNHP